MLCPVVRAQAAREQAIAVADVNLVARLGASSPNAASNASRPHGYVICGVAHHRGLACGATGGVDTHKLMLRNRKHAKGVSLAQIRFDGKGKESQIGQLFAIIRMNTH